MWRLFVVRLGTIMCSTGRSAGVAAFVRANALKMLVLAALCLTPAMMGGCGKSKDHASKKSSGKSDKPSKKRS